MCGGSNPALGASWTRQSETDTDSGRGSEPLIRGVCQRHGSGTIRNWVPRAAWLVVHGEKIRVKPGEALQYDEETGSGTSEGKELLEHVDGEVISEQKRRV